MRRDPRARSAAVLLSAVLSVLAGAVALAVGAGVAVGYVLVATWQAPGGLDAREVLTRPSFGLAVLLALGGSALALWGCRCWWQTRTTWQARGAGVAVLAVVATFLVVPVGGAATARWPPATPLRAGAPTLGPPGTLVAVEATASDGVVVRGVYRPSRNRAAVVVVPGSFGTRDGVVDQGTVLATRGFGVLLLDPRGNGASAGSPDGSGWSLRRDLAAAVGWLSARADVDRGRIAVLGESLGGEGALAALADDGRIAAAVAEGVTATVGADWDWLLRRGGLLGPLRWAVYRIGYGLLELSGPVAPPQPLAVSAARAAPRPVLLVVAGRVPDEAEAAEVIRAAAPASVQVWRVPGAGHARGLQEGEAAWTDRVAGFLAQALQVPQAG